MMMLCEENKLYLRATSSGSGLSASGSGNRISPCLKLGSTVLALRLI